MLCIIFFVDFVLSSLSENNYLMVEICSALFKCTTQYERLCYDSYEHEYDKGVMRWQYT